MPGISKQVSNRPAIGYAIALAIVIASLLLRYGMVQYFRMELPLFLTFYPAIMMIAIIAGFGPGLFATVLSAFATRYLILPAVGQPGIAKASQVVTLSFFTVMGILMSLIAESY